MNRFAVTNWSLALLLEAGLVATYLGRPREEPLYFLAAFSLFPAFYLYAAFRLHQDAFALGSIYIALLFELAIFWGWTNSPQLEKTYFLWSASALPVVFILVVVLFTYLQKEA